MANKFEKLAEQIADILDAAEEQKASSDTIHLLRAAWNSARTDGRALQAFLEVANDIRDDAFDAEQEKGGGQ